MSKVDEMARSSQEPSPPPQSSPAPESGQTKDAPSQQRLVIKTATITVEVSLYDSMTVQVQKLVQKKRGYIVSSTANSQEANKKNGVITVRVPANSFDETLADISRISTKVLYTSIAGNDVTEEYYDLSARLENKQKVEVRYREILKSAKSVEEILSVEKYLGEVREDIERMEGRKRFLNDQVALSTITINFQEPQTTIDDSGISFWSKISTGFRQGFIGFGDTLSFAITFTIAAIPVIILLIVFIYLVLILARKYKLWKKKS